VLDKLRKAAEKNNEEASRGRLKSDWIEPETLFWSAWKALPPAHKSAIAVEVIESFAAYVEDAHEFDPRKSGGDPMLWHRHRVHPELWKSLAASKTSLAANPIARRELESFEADRKRYLSIRPAFSPVDEPEPWK